MTKRVRNSYDKSGQRDQKSFSHAKSIGSTYHYHKDFDFECLRGMMNTPKFKNRFTFDARRSSRPGVLRRKSAGLFELRGYNFLIAGRARLRDGVQDISQLQCRRGTTSSSSSVLTFNSAVCRCLTGGALILKQQGADQSFIRPVHVLPHCPLGSTLQSPCYVGTGTIQPTRPMIYDL